ncbi:phosphodiester glycosidase family protein [Carboxydocella sp. ULO1]|uniref:phosphodiester glycosidase family protein n=1 Tax=Carboxydocella sp. ULO1 TaxID=1926599 RepID=UPI0009D1BB1E|nr:phosphodiester glycosidase family protein [Carboxydocella sp. ULO1]GAW28697.1 hypothetical protein ULO1_12670 [Carboxydocella sp. ULO1]
MKRHNRWLKGIAVFILMTWLLGGLQGEAATATVTVTQKGAAVSGGPGVSYRQYDIKIGSKKTVLKAVSVDLKTPGLRLAVALGGGQVGKTASLEALARSKNGIAAVNGTYFNSYSDFQPQGNLLVEGIPVHTGNTGTTALFTRTGELLMERLQSEVTGSINGSWDYRNNWYAWGLNHVYAEADASAVFTPARGLRTGTRSGKEVIVRQGRVVAISGPNSQIPADGFVIHFGPGSKAQAQFNKFRVGDRVQWRLNWHIGSKTGPILDWRQGAVGLGAGPLLVKNGRVVVNPQAEGITHWKQTQAAGPKSFVAILPGKVVLMGNISDATVYQLAAVLQKLGVRDAMALDGGASTGLYWQGKYLTRPGRLLSNALVVVRGSAWPAAQVKPGWEIAADLVKAGKFEEALQYDPQNPDAHYQLGLKLKAAGQLTEAARHLDEAFRLNPRNEEAINTLGWLYYSQRQYDLAIQAFQEEIRWFPQKANGYYGLGLCYAAWDVKDYAAARLNLNKAVALDPGGTVGAKARAALVSLPQ